MGSTLRSGPNPGSRSAAPPTSLSCDARSRRRHALSDTRSASKSSVCRAFPSVCGSASTRRALPPFERRMSSLDALFSPKSVAVIGASTDRGSIGREILHNIIEYEFNGKLFPVNPRAEFIHSIKCYPSVLDIPDEVDLAIIVVPARVVIEVVRQCGAKGVKGLVVISAGFKETGVEGA